MKKRFINMIGAPVPSSGPVELLRHHVKANWCEKCVVHQYGSGFSITCDASDGGKMPLTPEDGFWLIDELKLGAHTIHPFRRAVQWKD